MNNINNIPVAVAKRSSVNMSATQHYTTDFGRLDCVYHTELVPGDDVKIKLDGFLRGAPMPAPTFGSIKADIRVFFVPHRILTNRTSWNFDDWITGVTSSSHPYFIATAIANLLDSTNANYIGADYEQDLRRHLTNLGYPVKQDGTIYAPANFKINPFSFLAYQRIWWDYYRDSSLIPENLINSYIPPIGSGQISTSSYLTSLLSPRYACFKKDYFTTAKVYPQQGVDNAGAEALDYVSTTNTRSGVVAPSNPNNVLSVNPSNNTFSIQGNSFVSGDKVVPINWLRAANALQRYLERNNLAGTRLTERFLARFGVTPPAVALDMAEYLGGNSSQVRIGDVTANNENMSSAAGQFNPANAFNTLDANGDGYGTMQGQQGGKAAVDMTSGYVEYHSKEFGTLMAIQTLVPEVDYIQGLRADFLRGVSNDRFEYFTPEMENMGYEPVRASRLFFEDVNHANDIFGFVPRYQHYKLQNGVVAGDLVLAGTREGMDSLHLARVFSQQPTLNPAFTQITPDARHGLDRIFSVVGNVGQYDHFQGTCHADCVMSRPMSHDVLPSLEEDANSNTVAIQNGGVRM